MLVDDVLSISGKHSLIVDFETKDKEAKTKHEEECVRVKPLEERDIKDAIQKHGELHTQIAKKPSGESFRRDGDTQSEPERMQKQRLQRR